MVSTETPGPLEARHLPCALALSEEAGWNQVAADWLLMLEQGRAIGVSSEGDGALVGSALALPMGGNRAWISMVLVKPTYRRRGIAGRLVADCLQWLEERGSEAVLDATVAGAQVYRTLGFETVRRLTRWQRSGEEVGSADPDEDLLPITEADLVWLGALDEATFGSARPFVLRDLIRRPGAVCLREETESFALSRRGRVATQIGPLTSPDVQSAIRMLRGMLTGISGPVFVDAYDDQAVFVRYLEEAGFHRQRGFERMVRGQDRSFGDPSRSFVAAGPELG